MPDHWRTYRRADSELFFGEYTFLTELDGTEDLRDERYVEIVEETWTLLNRRTLKLGDLNRECDVCDKDLELEEAVDGAVYCAQHVPEEASDA